MGRWQQSSLSPPNAQAGSLRARHAKPLIPGVAVGLGSMVPPNAWFDPDSGWFCMGNTNVAPDAEAVAFAMGCLAVVVRGRLSSLWIKKRICHWRPRVTLSSTEMPTKIDGDGVIRVYDPKTNIFGSFNADGTTDLLHARSFETRTAV